MKPETVIWLLDELQAAGVDAWVDGGWGVDGLFGHRRGLTTISIWLYLSMMSVRIMDVLGAQARATAHEPHTLAGRTTRNGSS